MKRAFYLLDQLRDVIEGKSRLEVAEVARDDSEWMLPGRGPPARQAAPKHLIDDLAKGPSRTAGLGLQLGGHVIIQGECRSHIMMLHLEHHDVNAGPARFGRGVRCAGHRRHRYCVRHPTLRPQRTLPDCAPLRGAPSGLPLEQAQAGRGGDLHATSLY